MSRSSTGALVGVTIINLERNEDRRRFMRRSCRAAQVPVSYFKAIDGAAFDYSELTSKSSRQFVDWLEVKGTCKEVRSTIACALSHRELMAELSDTLKEGEWQIVFEDDVSLQEGFWSVVPDLISAASSSSFKMVLLGAHWPYSGVSDLKSGGASAAGYVIAEYPDVLVNGAFAYAITKSGAAHIAMKQAPKVRVQADNWLEIWPAANRSKRIGLVVPQLVTTGYFESNMGYNTKRFRRRIRRLLVRVPLFRRFLNRAAPSKL